MSHITSLAGWAKQPLTRDDRVHAKTLALSRRHFQIQANLDHFRVLAPLTQQGLPFPKVMSACRHSNLLLSLYTRFRVPHPANKVPPLATNLPPSFLSSSRNHSSYYSRIEELKSPAREAAHPRPSMDRMSILPTIKCSSCGVDIDILHLADHVCVPDLPSGEHKVPIKQKSKLRDPSSLSSRPIRVNVFVRFGKIREVWRSII